jgi:hypothetical protein
MVGSPDCPMNPLLPEYDLSAHSDMRFLQGPEIMAQNRAFNELH